MDKPFTVIYIDPENPNEHKILITQVMAENGKQAFLQAACVVDDNCLLIAALNGHKNIDETITLISPYPGIVGNPANSTDVLCAPRYYNIDN